MDPSLTDFRGVLSALHTDRFGRSRRSNELLEKAKQLADANTAISVCDWSYFERKEHGERLMLASLEFIPDHVLRSAVDLGSLFDFLIAHDMFDPICYILTQARIIPLNDTVRKDALITCVVRSSLGENPNNTVYGPEFSDERCDAVLECVLSLLHGGYVVDSWQNLLMVARAYESKPVIALVAGHVPVDTLETMTHYPTAREFGVVRYRQKCASEMEIIRDFISHGGVVNTNAVREDSLLHIALEYHPTGYHDDESIEDYFDILVEAGADLLKPDSVGNTPLHIAAANSGTWMCQMLLRRAQAQGVDLKEFVNRRNDMNETAMDYLLRARRRYFNPLCKSNVWLFFIHSLQHRNNADLLMALGATVSRRNVIRLKHLIPSDEMFRIARTHFTIGGELSALVFRANQSSPNHGNSHVESCSVLALSSP